VSGQVVHVGADEVGERLLHVLGQRRGQPLGKRLRDGKRSLDDEPVELALRAEDIVRHPVGDLGERGDVLQRRAAKPRTANSDSAASRIADLLDSGLRDILAENI
jgi:hypothetical protein